MILASDRLLVLALGVSLSCCWVASQCHAAAPEVTGLMPAGAQRGTEVVVELDGKFDVKQLELWTETPGIELAGTEGKSSVRLKVAESTPTGVAWLAFQNKDGISNLRPFVIGTLPEIQEKESNDEPSADAVPLTLPVVVNGTLKKSGDVDGWPIELAAAQTLVATADAFQRLGSPMDTTLQLVDARGFVVAQNDDAFGMDSQLVFKSPRAQRYFLRIFAFPSEPNSSIRFSSGSGYHYRISVVADQVALTWEPAAVTAGVETVLSATVLELEKNSSTSPLEISTTGFHFPDVKQPYAAAPIHVVPEPVVAATSENTAETPQSVTIPVCVSGCLDKPKAAHGWKIEGKKGQRLRFQVATTAIRSPVDAVLRVLDASGKSLLEVDDTKQSEYDVVSELTLPADGVYRAVVQDRFWHGSPRHVYTLRITNAVPEADLTVSQAVWTMHSGKSLEIPVTINRKTGFKEEFQVSVTGLPEGVSAEPAKSETKGDSAKSVKLILKGEVSEPWTGRIQIEGASDDKTPWQAAAIPAPVEGQLTASTIVLRVLPKAEKK